MKGVVHVRVIAAAHRMNEQVGTVPLEVFEQAARTPGDGVFTAMFADGPESVHVDDVEVVMIADGHFVRSPSTGGGENSSGARRG